jgi:hypothetical protein
MINFGCSLVKVAKNLLINAWVAYMLLKLSSMLNILISLSQ